MADTTETEIPIWGDELEDYLDIGAAIEDWGEATNLLSFEFGDDEETYEPSYIDTRKKKKFVMDSTASIDYEKDAYKGNKLDAFLIQHEDDSNIPVRVCRVQTWNDNKAKCARFLLTPKQLDKNSSGEPIKLKGSLTMSDDDWTYGTWKDGHFVADGSEEPTVPTPDTTTETEDVQG